MTFEGKLYFMKKIVLHYVDILEKLKKVRR